MSCRGTDVELSDCGYTTFNPGTAKCKKCGYTVEVKTCDIDADASLRKAWNGERDRLRTELRGIKKRIGELRKLGIY